jgi:hypothetical protein
MAAEKTVVDHFNSLFDFLTKTLEIYESYRLRKNENIILTHLNNFVRAFRLSGKDTSNNDFPEIFLNYFREIFLANQEEILKDHHQTDWLANKGITVQFGEELKDDPNKFKKFRNIKIHLSAIYNTSLRLREEMEEKLKSATADEYSKHLELIFPDIILLHLYRIFKNCSTDQEKIKKLTEIELAIKKEIGREKDEPSADEARYGDVKSRSLAEKVKNSGPSLGSSAGIPGDDIRKAMGRFFNMPVISGTISSMMEKAKVANDPSELIGEFIGKITSPEFTEEMAKARDAEDDGENCSIEEGIKKAIAPSISDKESEFLIGNIGTFVDKAVAGASSLDTTGTPDQVLTNLVSEISASSPPVKTGMDSAAAPL